MKELCRLKILAAAFLTLSLLSGCAGKSATKKDNLSKEELMNQAKSEKMRGKHSAAREKFQRVFEESTDNELRAKALMEVADSYYQEQEFTQAEFNYKRFLEHFPAHPEAVKAQYRLGMANFIQLKPYDRDQSNTKKSIEEFKKVVDKYPNTAYTADARRKINFSINRLALHELYVSKYYYNRKAYKASVSRLEGILSDYPGVEFEDEILFLLGQSYLGDNKKANAADIFKKLTERHPNSKHTSQARTTWRIDLDKAEIAKRNEKAAAAPDSGTSSAQSEDSGDTSDLPTKEGKRGIFGRIGSGFKGITHIFK